MVILLDKHKKPLGFATERRVRKLFEAHRAVMYRRFPTVVIVKDVDFREIENLPTYRVKIDPGSKTTGIAIIREDTGEFVWAMQIEHRAQQVRKNIQTHAMCRRNRRSRETWYRRSKFADGGQFEHDNKEGTLPPSIMSVIGNTETWIRRLSRWINITDASLEAVRFDTQLLDDPNIEGKEYQHGTLAGTEIREYLLNKYQGVCQYCGGKSGDPILEWEHIVPRSRGGANKVSNATLACHICNQQKGSLMPQEWLEQIEAKPHKSELDEARIAGIQNVINHKQAGKSSRYCAWVNTTRNQLENFLFAMFDDVECASGGRTKWNRTRFKLLKDHQYDAVCVGVIPENGYIDRTHGYYISAQAIGRGTHFVHVGKTNGCGVIVGKPAKKVKQVDGFMTGDIVMADVPHREPKPYKFEGQMLGRIAIRASGSFDLRAIGAHTKIVVNKRYLHLIQHADGYDYVQNRTTSRNNQIIRKDKGVSSRQ